jgi:hypothetical protein
MINVRHKGHVAERAVANYLKDHGYPLAITSRLHTGGDGISQESDVIGVPGVSIEVKNRQNLNIGAALVQAAVQGGPTKVPLLIAKPYGIGLNSVGDWWAITYVRSLVPLLPREGDL